MIATTSSTYSSSCLLYLLCIACIQIKILTPTLLKYISNIYSTEKVAIWYLFCSKSREDRGAKEKQYIIPTLCLQNDFQTFLFLFTAKMFVCQCSFKELWLLRLRLLVRLEPRYKYFFNSLVYVLSWVHKGPP